MNLFNQNPKNPIRELGKGRSFMMIIPSVTQEVAFEGRRLRDIVGGGGLIGAANEDVRS